MDRWLCVRDVLFSWAQNPGIPPAPAQIRIVVRASFLLTHRTEPNFTAKCDSGKLPGAAPAYLIRRLLANDLALLLAAGLGGCTYPASSSSLRSSSESSRLQAPERSEARVAERAGWEGGRRGGEAW